MNQTSIPEKSIPRWRRHLWWLYLLCAIISYMLVKYLPPLLFSEYPEAYQELGGYIAPILAVIFLVLAANSLYENPLPPESQADDTPGEHQEE